MVRTALLSLALLLAAAPLEAEPYKGFPRGDALISAAGLKSLLDGHDPKPVVLAAVGRAPWLLGRIPGARRVQRRAYTDRGGMAAGRARFQAFARGLGIDDRTPVVVYDNTYDAARPLVAVPALREDRCEGAGRRLAGLARGGLRRPSAAPAGRSSEGRELHCRARAGRLDGRFRRSSASPPGSGNACMGRARHTGMEGNRPYRRSPLHRLAGVSQGGRGPAVGVPHRRRDRRPAPKRRASGRTGTTSSTAIPACAPPRRCSRST